MPQALLWTVAYGRQVVAPCLTSEGPELYYQLVLCPLAPPPQTIDRYMEIWGQNPGVLSVGLPFLTPSQSTITRPLEEHKAWFQPLCLYL